MGKQCPICGMNMVENGVCKGCGTPIISEEYISRDAVLSAILEYEDFRAPDYMNGWANKLKNAVCQDLFSTIDCLPAADIHPSGRWLGKPLSGYATVRCSVCGSAFRENTGAWAFCPNCGARME